MKNIGKIILPGIIILIHIGLFLALQYVQAEPETKDLIRKILNVTVTFSIAWFIMSIINAGKILLLRYFDISSEDNLEARKLHTRFSILEKTLFGIIIFIAVATALMNFESIRRIGISLFASAGIAGIIIGFAAQKLIGTFLAGVQLAITQPIRIDDVVIVEGEWGRIEEINLTYVVVKIWDKRRLIVPTTYFIEKPFQNWTRVSADILGTVFIYTDYSVPFNEIRKELEQVVRENEDWDGQVVNLQITNATESTVEMRALMSAKDSSSAWNLRVYVRERIIEYIKNNYPECLPKSRVEIQNTDLTKAKARQG
jgi:small-conductance mechanosensitive channel